MSDTFGSDALIENRTFLDLDEALPRDREFFRCTFRSCRWPEATLQGCAFESCTFEECDLTRCKPTRTSLRGATFLRCKLLGLDTKLLNDHPEVTFVECILRYAAFTDVNLRGSTITRCDLSDATFSECSLVDTDFVDCDLKNATFSRCDLAGADFSTSRDVYIDVRASSAAGAFVPVETAVMLAQAAGLAVAGYDKGPKRKRKR